MCTAEWKGDVQLGNGQLADAGAEVGHSFTEPLHGTDVLLQHCMQLLRCGGIFEP